MTTRDINPSLTESQKINLNIITLNTAINDLQNDVRTLNRIVIEGNGELPLREQVRNHESFIKDIKYWMRFLGGALILQTLAFLAGVFVAVVRFLPLLERLAQP